MKVIALVARTGNQSIMTLLSITVPRQLPRAVVLSCYEYSARGTTRERHRERETETQRKRQRERERERERKKERK